MYTVITFSLQYRRARRKHLLPDANLEVTARYITKWRVYTRAYDCIVSCIRPWCVITGRLTPVYRRL